MLGRDIERRRGSEALGEELAHLALPCHVLWVDEGVAMKN